MRMTKDRTDSLKRTEAIPVWEDCQVAVIGGGPAGISAATAAVRAGLRVILVEKDSLWEESLEGEAAGHGSPQPACGEGTGKRYPYTMAVEICRDGGRVTGLVAAGRTGLGLIRARALVDATGDGRLSVLAGASGERKPLYAEASFGLEQVDSARAAAWMKETGIACRVGGPDRTQELRFTLPELAGRGWSGILPKGEVRLVRYGSGERIRVDGLRMKADGWNESELETFLAQAGGELAAYLREAVPGLENSRTGRAASRIRLSGGFFPRQENSRVVGLENLFTVKNDVYPQDTGDGPSLRQAREAGRKAGEAAAAAVKAAGEAAGTPGNQPAQEWKRTILCPIRRDCDVLVAGGSEAGIAEALAAAQKGQQVILVERRAWLGDGNGDWNAREEERRLQIYGRLQEAGVEVNLNALLLEPSGEERPITAEDEKDAPAGENIRLAVIQERYTRYAIRTKTLVDTR